MVWWRHVGPVLSCPNGASMLQCFKEIKLPRLLLPLRWNYAAWHPYYAFGPRFFCYSQTKTMEFEEALECMFYEENDKADAGKSIISFKVYQEIRKIYSIRYTEGNWLTPKQKYWLTTRKKSML